MAADTKADDWFIAAHVLRVRTSSGTASISFKIGSRVANIAALLGCSGPISGSGVADTDFQLDTQLMRTFSGPFSLKDIKGHRGDVTQNVSFSPDDLSGVAFNKSGSVFFNFDLPNTNPMTFTIRGQWMVKMVLNLGTTFVI
ncbi:hypothetical protein AB7Z32_19585 [Bradyrhizobium sp. 482_C4_N1_1]|uniref:hypothetical protein n=1 Tax=Bradyrhizobium TaxID=374 RepID=UPI0024AF353B|nr:hypothetical protein [Bradyrhizobium barranii]WFT91889.1 hypothetical protein QA633_26425 [Bradyrhizobium barranii]